MSTIVSSHINLDENKLYENIIIKLDRIKETLNKIKNYSEKFDVETNKNINFLEKLSYFSTDLNNMDALVNDMYSEFVLESNPNELSHEDKNKRNNLIIEKKIQDTFLPYMLYFRVLLSNMSE
jgi:hypothetical protein